MAFTTASVSPSTPPAGAQTPLSARSLWQAQRVKLAISLVIAAAFAWTLNHGGLPLIPPARFLRQVDFSYCVPYLILTILWQTLRATRWRHLLAPISRDVPVRRIVNVALIGYAAILLLPLRAGEFVRPYMIREKGKISMAAATGTIGAERVIDGLYLTLLLGILLQIARPLSPLPDHIGKLQIPVAAVPFYAYLTLSVFVAATLVMALFCVRPTLARRLVEVPLSLVSRKLATKMADVAARMADGLKFLPSVRHLGPFLFESTLYWVLNALSMWALARACGIDSISMPQAVVIMGVLGVGILVPAGPGLFGAFQASTYAGLAMYFSDDVVLGPGGAFVFLLYVTQSIWQLLTGAVALLVERGHAVAAPGNSVAPST